MIIATNNPNPEDPNNGFVQSGGYTGTAKDLENAINVLALPDGFLKTTPLTKTGNDISIDPLDFKWRIDQVEYVNPNLFTRTINAAPQDYNRIDIIVATIYSAFVLIEGEPSLDSALEPELPDGTLKVAFISVFGDTINEPSNPIANGVYVSKVESFFLATTVSGVVNAFNLSKIGTGISFNGSATELHTISVANSLMLYPRRPLYIKNNQTTNLRIKHNGTGSGTYKFSFPNAQDFILKPGEIIMFKLLFSGSNSDSSYENNTNAGTYEYVGASTADLTNYYNKTEVDTADATTLTAAQTYAANLITQLINGAPSDSNTLKELSDKIIGLQAIVGGTAPDGDSIVNTVTELLAIFATFPEGVDLVTLLAGKVSTSDVYNILDCIVAGKVLDARQGKVLNDAISTLTTTLNSKEDSSNKSNSVADSASTVKFPVWAAIVSYFTQSRLFTILGISTLLGSNTGDETTSSILTKIGDGSRIGAAYLPSYVDDILEGYLLSNVFYNEVGRTTVIPAESGKVYIDITTGQKNKAYRWSGSTYIQITNGLIASTDDVAEGSINKYSTLATVMAYALTGVSFATGTAITAADTIMSAFGKLQKQISDNLTAIGFKQDTLVPGTNIKNINSISILGIGNIITPDMDTTTAQSVSGVKTFLSGMFGIRNVANTFTSFFTNANTASRTYTLQNRNGILADDTDLSGKQSVFAGIANYITKSLNTNTLIISRLFDNGTFFGIGTVNVPTKDITLGNQSNKEIGIEESSSTLIGRDLIVSAGRTINYAPTTFVALNQQTLSWNCFTGHSNGNVYAATYIGTAPGIYLRTNGLGNFNLIQSLNAGLQSMDSHSSGDVFMVQELYGFFKQTLGTGAFSNYPTPNFPTSTYGYVAVTTTKDIYLTQTTGDIYVQTAASGNFNALGQISRAYKGISAHINGNVYAIGNTEIYMRTGGAGNFNTLSTGLSCSDIKCAPNGNVYVISGGVVFVQSVGTGPFVNAGLGGPGFSKLGISSNGDIYASNLGKDIYIVASSQTGTADIKGGALKLKAGTGKGTGQSRVEFITGQKKPSGTDMQIDTLRAYIDENGFFVYLYNPIYANDAAADADINLPSGGFYKITGNRTTFQKP